MRQKRADVTARRETARRPQTISQRGSRQQTYEGECRLRSSEPLARRPRCAFLACQCACRKQQKGEISGKGIVLLVGGDGKEKQDHRGIDGQQPGGSGTEERRARRHGIRRRPQPVTPTTASIPCSPESDREIDAPRKEPDQVQAPIKSKGQFVVVHWITLAQKPQHLLVDKVEIEEAVNIAGSGDIARGVAGTGIAQPGEDVPGGSNGEEQQNAGGQTELAPAAPFSSEQEIGHGSKEEKDRGHQPLG